MAKESRAQVALDEDVRRLLARLLSDRGWDAVSIVDTGRCGLSDHDQLAWATRERRVLLTRNAADFASLATDWARSGRDHAGIFIARQGPTGWLLREILRALAQRPGADDWTNRIAWAGPLLRRR